MLYEEGLAAWRALGDARGIAYTLANLVLAARERGAWERALALYGKSLALYEGLGDTGGRAFVLTSLGDVARAWRRRAGRRAVRGEPRPASRGGRRPRAGAPRGCRPAGMRDNVKAARAAASLSSSTRPNRP